MIELGTSRGWQLLPPEMEFLQWCEVRSRGALQDSYLGAYDGEIRKACSPVSASLRGSSDAAEGFLEYKGLERYGQCPPAVQAEAVRLYRQAYALKVEEQARETERRMLQQQLEGARAEAERRERNSRLRRSRVTFDVEGHPFTTTCEVDPEMRRALVTVSTPDRGKTKLTHWIGEFLRDDGHYLGRKNLKESVKFKRGGTEEFNIYSRDVPSGTETCRARGR